MNKTKRNKNKIKSLKSEGDGRNKKSVQQGAIGVKEQVHHCIKYRTDYSRNKIHDSGVK